MGLFDGFMDIITLGGYSEIMDQLSGADAAKDAAKLQDEYNVKNWNMQNEYNKPANQMKRYEEAGLNPNLIYTQSNTADSVGQVNVKPADSLATTASKFLSIAGAVQGLKQGALNLANTRANTAHTVADTANTVANTANVEAVTKNLNDQNSLIRTQQQMQQAELDRYRYETDWLKSRGLSTYSSVLERNLGFPFYNPNVKKFASYVGEKVGSFHGDMISHSADYERKVQEAERKRLERRDIIRGRRF